MDERKMTNYAKTCMHLYVGLPYWPHTVAYMLHTNRYFNVEYDKALALVNRLSHEMFELHIHT